MRRFVIAAFPLFVLAALPSCGGDEPQPVTPKAAAAEPSTPPTLPPAEPPPAPKPSLAELQKTALMTALVGLNSHDPMKFASVYADDAVIEVAGLQEVRGRDAIANNMAEWFETFKDIKLGFSRVWVKGETMVLEWVINGKHHGQLFGVKGKEEPIGHYGLSVVTFNPDGKVTSEHRYGELGAVMSQVGAAKGKAAPIPPVPEKPETIVSKGAPEEEKNAELAKKVFTSLEEKKEADFTANITDDMEQDGLFHLQTTKGKEEAKKFFKGFTTAFPDAKFDVKRTITFGDYAIVESIMKATHKGPLGTIPATKKPVSLHLADIVKVKDGKVARAWTYQNGLELQDQLGLHTVGAAGNVPASQAPAKPPAPAGTTAPAPAPKK
jgi:steroid delta-isomerase-like uncharacterized protein